MTVEIRDKISSSEDTLMALFARMDTFAMSVALGASLALGLGAGSELQKPLALAVIGGLALSTPITLYVVPTLLVAIRGRDYSLNRSIAQ